MKVKEESKRASIKFNTQKTKIRASGPISLWQIDGETMETVTEFILGAQTSLEMVTAAIKLKDICSLEENLRRNQGPERVRGKPENTAGVP